MPQRMGPPAVPGTGRAITIGRRPALMYLHAPRSCWGARPEAERRREAALCHRARVPARPRAAHLRRGDIRAGLRDGGRYHGVASAAFPGAHEPLCRTQALDRQALRQDRRHEGGRLATSSVSRSWVFRVSVVDNASFLPWLLIPGLVPHRRTGWWWRSATISS